jgi:hypothetical protein
MREIDLEIEIPVHFASENFSDNSRSIYAESSLYLGSALAESERLERQRAEEKLKEEQRRVAEEQVRLERQFTRD